MSGNGANERRRAERQSLQTDVEFIIDGDIEKATAVDISESGVRFDTREPMKVHMRLEVDHRRREFLARLVWARRNADGTMAYGLEFVPDDDKCIF